MADVTQAGLDVRGDQVLYTTNTAAWTSATGSNTAVTANVVNYGSAGISLVQGTTLTGGAVTFEASDDNGTTWFTINPIRRNTGQTESVYTLTASTNLMWVADTAGITNLRVRLSTVITGTGTVTVRIVPTAFTRPTSMSIQGAQTANSTAAWTSGTTLNTALSINVQSFNVVSLAMSNTSTMTGGVLTFEVSPDNVTWFPVSQARLDSYTVESTYTLNTVANRAWSTSVDGFNWYRVRLSTVITGTGTANLYIAAQTFTIEPIVSATIIANNATQTTVAASASSVTLLAANTNRRGATIFNDSTATMYLLLNSTAASNTSYSVMMTPNAYYEVPFGYAGQINGIWTAANGNARISELT